MVNFRPQPSYLPRRPFSAIRRRLPILFAVFLLPPLLAFAGEPGPLPAIKQGTPAAYTSLKKFPQNLGGNFLAVFSKKNIVPLVIGSAATGVIAPFDHEIKDHWGSTGGSTTVGQIGSVLGGPAVVIPAVTGLFIAGQRSKNDRFHSFTYALAQGAVINEGMVQAIKFSVGRTRPDGSNNQSFPSGHAATSFMIATVAERYYGWKAGIIGYSTATFIAVARARDNKHWATDLTAGATLGYIVGSSVCRRTGISMRVGKITLVPAFDLKHRRVGISFITDSD